MSTSLTGSLWMGQGCVPSNTLGGEVTHITVVSDQLTTLLLQTTEEPTTVVITCVGRGQRLSDTTWRQDVMRFSHTRKQEHISV